MEADKGSTHSDEKTPKKSSPSSSTETGTFFSIPEKLEVDSTENNERLSVGRSSNPVSKEDGGKIKVDEKSIERSSSINLLEGSHTEVDNEIKSFESSITSSHEDKSKEQLSESNSLNTPLEFKQVISTESTGEEFSDKSEGALPGGSAAVSLTYLQADSADKRSKSGSDKDSLERSDELPDPAVAEATLQYAAGGERRGSKGSDNDSDFNQISEPPTDNQSDQSEPVQQPDPNAEVPVSGDGVEGINARQGFYERICCSDVQIVSTVLLLPGVFLLLLATICLNSRDVIAFVFGIIFAILGVICVAVAIYNLIQACRSTEPIEEHEN